LPFEISPSYHPGKINKNSLCVFSACGLAIRSEGNNVPPITKKIKDKSDGTWLKAEKPKTDFLPFTQNSTPKTAFGYRLWKRR